MRKPTLTSVNERNFQLKVEPNKKLVFCGDVLGEITTGLKIRNHSESRQAFKVKCTRNDLFTIRPTIGILDYRETVYIKITYRCLNNQYPESNRHHFGIYHIPAPEGCTAAGAWAEHYGPPQGEFRLKVFFEDTGSRSDRKVDSSKNNGNAIKKSSPSDE